MPKLDERITALEARLQDLKTKQQTKERAARQAERQRARKVENQRKFQLGGLFKIADLFEHDAGALLGALLTLRPLLSDPVQFGHLKTAGDSLLAQREQDRKEAASAAVFTTSTADEYLK